MGFDDPARPRRRPARQGEPGRSSSEPAPVVYLHAASDSAADAAARQQSRETHPAGSGRPDRTERSADRADRNADRTERRAENVSLSALTRRGMSRWELEKTLLSRELDPEIVAAELERLESVGLVDDATLADTIVRTQHDRKGLGRGALTAELRRRHIDQEHIEAALEQVDDDDEISRARELAERRARQLMSLDRATAVRRLTGYLLRKGYGSSVVRTAVDDALAGHTGGGGVRFR